MICFATEDMIPGLKALWLEGFPGDTEYCDFYFDRLFSCENCVVALNDQGEVVSTLHFFPGEVRIGGKVYPMPFGYAGSTTKEYRRRGLLGDIFQFIWEHCRKNNIPFFCGSTSSTSNSVCEKQGMRPRIDLCATTVMVDSVESTSPCEKCGYEEFAALRAAYIPGEFEIYWPEKTLRYMYAEMQTSGDMVKTVIGGNTYYIAYTMMEDELLIRETNCPAEDMQALVDALCASISYRGQVTVYTKPDVRPVLRGMVSQETFCYAHICFMDESFDIPGAKWYVNLTAE